MIENRKKLPVVLAAGACDLKRARARTRKRVSIKQARLRVRVHREIRPAKDSEESRQARCHWRSCATAGDITAAVCMYASERVRMRV